MNNDSAAQSEHRSRWPMIIICIVAIGSLGGSYLYFFLVQSGSMNFGTVNNGSFVSPALNAADLSLSHGGEAFDTDGKWWLWTVEVNGCDVDCVAAIDRGRASHVLLNREASRVRRAVIAEHVTEGLDTKDAIWLTGPVAGVLKDGAYLVDPNGNLVFFYSFDQVGKPLLDDLKRLLKVSQIG